MEDKASPENIPTKIAVKMIDEMQSPAKPVRLRDKNWVWPIFILALAYLLTLAIVYSNFYTGDTLTIGESVLRLIIVVVSGFVLGVIAYNLGKWLSAVLSGYRLVYLALSGITWHYGAARSWSFDGSLFFEFHAGFAPKNESRDANPTFMFFGGLLLWGAIFALSLILAFVLDLTETLKWGLVFGAAVSATYPLYQLLPVRQDYISDGYSLITTKTADDKRAFNIVAINAANDFADKELLLPTFIDYDTYWKIRTLPYLYLDNLYRTQVDKAVDILSLIHENANYLNSLEKAQVATERLFILLLLNDVSGANNLFIALPKTTKTETVRLRTLSSCRNRLLISGIILNREDTSVLNVKRFKTLLPQSPTSLKMKQEVKYYTLAYHKVLQSNPKFDLPPLAPLD